MFTLVDRAREARWLHVICANLRILIGFAFVPAGLKKLLNEPFTDPENTGAFHEFLHAFHDTGVFYQFVGVAQLCIAVLLMTQTFATLGALLALPVITAIMVFCWSTLVIPTATVTTLMWAGILALVIWDYPRWRGIVSSDPPRTDSPSAPADSSGLIDLALWRACGAGILGLYALITAISGGVYRPRGVELDNPAFYMMPMIALFPFATLAIEQRRRRLASRPGGAAPAPAMPAG